MTKETAMRVLGLTAAEADEAGERVLALIPDEPLPLSEGEMAEGRRALVFERLCAGVKRGRHG